MSQENVEAFQGGIEAYNDQDAEALLNVCDPEGGMPPRTHNAARRRRKCERDSGQCPLLC